MHLIDTHCHLLNFKFIPDKFLKTRVRIEESVLRKKWARGLAWIYANLPFVKANRLHEYLALFNQDIFRVAEDMDAEMTAANIDLAIPLMMDLATASFGQKPETPYRLQIHYMSRIALKYPGRIMPFVMLDPRRPGSGQMVIKALDKLGFLGVKMYPPLGYHPDPDSIINPPAVNDELQEVYKYCEDNCVPITTHCSPGGAYGSDIYRDIESLPQYTHPSNWVGVLNKYPELYLNLSHGGGRWLHDNSWWPDVLNLIRTFPHVFADVAYHDEALENNTQAKYFKMLSGILATSGVQDRILFATDWPMIRHRWRMQDFVAPFVARLLKPQLQQIAFDNPINFLFCGGKMPKRIQAFYEADDEAKANVPDWLKTKLHY